MQHTFLTNSLSRLSVGMLTALAFFTPGAMATNAGTDLNLDHHIVAAGMAGAAYTRPQEVSAAVAGNPATLRQFDQGQYNFGASLLPIKELKNVQTTRIDTLNTTFTNESVSSAENYIVPTFGMVLSDSKDWTWAAGLEVDAGIGADFRDDPIYLLGGAGTALGLGSPVSLPLVVELISLNANLAAAYQATPELSLGASLTVGFGFAQLGTVGPTQGLSALDKAAGGLGLSDFGGTTSSVHDIAFAASLGAVWQVNPQWTLSATWKSELGYEFDDILRSNTYGLQSLPIEQPSEWIAGSAFEEGDLLVELDVVFKDWESADTYQDLYENQALYNLGMQISDLGIKGLDWRIGYSYATQPLRDTPNNTLASLREAGSIPLGSRAQQVGLNGLAVDVMKIVQMTLTLSDPHFLISL